MSDTPTPRAHRVVPAVEAPRTNGHDKRADDTPEEGMKRPNFEERVESAILEILGKLDVTSRDVATSRHSADTRMKAINANHDGLAERIDGVHEEMRKGFARVDANLDAVVHEQKRQNEAFSVSPMMRPPLPSLTEDELDVLERTHNGTAVYKVSDPQFRAIRETDVRHALREFAVGESERTQVAIEAALRAEAAKAAEAKRLADALEDARLVRFVRNDLSPTTVKAAVGFSATALLATIYAWLHSFFTNRH